MTESGEGGKKRDVAGRKGVGGDKERDGVRMVGECLHLSNTSRRCCGATTRLVLFATAKPYAPRDNRALGRRARNTLPKIARKDRLSIRSTRSAALCWQQAKIREKPRCAGRPGLGCVYSKRKWLCT